MAVLVAVLLLASLGVVALPSAAADHQIARTISRFEKLEVQAKKEGTAEASSARAAADPLSSAALRGARESRAIVANSSAANSSAAGTSRSARVAVIVTLYEPKPGVEKLLRTLEGDLRGTGLDFYAFVDSQHLHGQKLAKVQKLVGGEERVIEMDYNGALSRVFPHADKRQKKSFGIFEGLKHSPAKPGSIWWLADGPGKKYDYTWIIESDVHFDGNWLALFNDNSFRDADLVAKTDIPEGDDVPWVHWDTCTHPGCARCRGDQMCKRSFLAVTRISRRLAQDVIETLRKDQYTGHHEAFLYTICHDETQWRCTTSDLASSSWMGVIGWNPEDVPQHRVRNKLYHPVKAF